MRPGELGAAFRIVWYVISAIIAAILLAPWVLNAQQISLITPKCEWKARHGKECAFCGMTTAFIAISAGKLTQARAANRGAMPLYAGFTLNEAGALVWVWRRRYSRRPC